MSWGTLWEYHLYGYTFDCSWMYPCFQNDLSLWKQHPTPDLLLFLKRCVWKWSNVWPILPRIECRYQCNHHFRSMFVSQTDWSQIPKSANWSEKLLKVAELAKVTVTQPIYIHKAGSQAPKPSKPDGIRCLFRSRWFDLSTSTETCVKFFQ